MGTDSALCPQSLWVERTSLYLVQSLPGISRWFEVDKREVVRTPPCPTPVAPTSHSDSPEALRVRQGMCGSLAAVTGLEGGLEDRWLTRPRALLAVVGLPGVCRRGVTGVPDQPARGSPQESGGQQHTGSSGPGVTELEFQLCSRHWLGDLPRCCVPGAC